MTKEQALTEMTYLATQNNDDPEHNHGEADRILCDLLDSLGYQEIVTAYNKITKWYA